MIQKQVLKMHRKKAGIETKPPLPVTRYSQGSKNVKSDKAPSDSLFSVGFMILTGLVRQGKHLKMIAQD